MTQMDLFRPNQEYLDIDKMQKDLKKHNQKLKEANAKRKQQRNNRF